MIESAVIEGLLAILAVVLGWLHMRQTKLEDKLDDCVKASAFEEVKQELHEVKNILTEVRVENAEWHGLMQKAIEKSSENS